MKRILICLEAMDYNFIIENKFKTLMSLDPHPAVAFGLGSRPSAAALLGGMLPVCQIPHCDHRKLRDIWNSPFFMTLLREVTSAQYFLCPNGWILELLLPWMPQEHRNLNFKWHDDHESCPSTELVEYFLKDSKELDNYFAYLHLFESHWPFYSPEGTGDRVRSTYFLDSLVKRVIEERPEAEIVVVSDHNLPPRITSAAEDVPAATTMLSFFACNETAYEGKPWSKLVPKIGEVVKKAWWIK